MFFANCMINTSKQTMCWRTVMDGPPGSVLERDKGTKSNGASAKQCRAALPTMLPCALWDVRMLCRTTRSLNVGLYSVNISKTCL